MAIASNGAAAGLEDLHQIRRRFARNIPVYYLFHGVSGFLIWMPIWVIYLQEFRGMSLTQISTIESLFWLTVVLAEVPTGAVADRWGRRTSLVMGGACFCLGSVVFAFSSTYVVLLAAYVMVAIAITLYSGAGHALIYDTLRQTGRTRDYEKHIGRSDAMAFGAMLIATLLGGPLVALVGYSVTILLGAIAMGLAGCIALLLREPPRSEAEISSLQASEAGENGTANQSGQTGQTGAPRSGLLANMLSGVMVVWRRKTLFWYILFGTVIVAVITITEFLLQPFVVQHGVDPSAGVTTGFTYSGMLMSPVAGMVVGSLLAAWVASRFGERRSLVVLLFAGAILFLVPTLWNSLWVVVGFGMLAAIRGMTRPIATGYINRRIPSDQRATVLSMFQLSTALMIAIIIPIAGSVADMVGFQASFGSLLLILLIAGGVFAMVWRRLHGREQAVVAITLNSMARPQATNSP